MQNTEEEPINLETIQTAPAAYRRYLSSSAAATLHGKIQGFVLRLPPKKKSPCNIHGSHYNAFCRMAWLTRMHLRTWHHQMSTIMQPFQCDLQPQVQETHGTTHTGTTTRCRTQRRNRLTSKRSKPHPPHTGGTFHRRLQPLYTQKRKVSCSGFLPKTKPMQHSCSHYNAFCSMTWLTRMHLRTWHHQMTTIMQPFRCDLQPQVQETHRTTPQQKPHATFMQVNSFVMYCYVV